MTKEEFLQKHEKNVKLGFDGLDGLDVWQEFQIDLNAMIEAEVAEAREIVQDFEKRHPYCYEMCEIDVPKGQFLKMSKEALLKMPRRHEPMCARINALLGPRHEDVRGRISTIMVPEPDSVPDKADGNPWAPNKDFPGKPT